MTTETQLLRDIERKRMLAAEQAVIASIPTDLLAHMRKKQAEFEAAGGCPGCGSTTLAVHNIPCKVADNDIY
jgi:hypothetical protein